MELKERVHKALAGLMVAQPFVGLFAKSTWILFDEKLPLTACTDGLRIYLGPAAASLTPRELADAIAHEALHIMLKHPLRGRAIQRRTGLPHGLLNIIADAIVNHHLREAQLQLLPGAVLPEHIESAFGVKVVGRSFEEVAEDIAKLMERIEVQIPSQLEPTIDGDIFGPAPSAGGQGQGEERAGERKGQKKGSRQGDERGGAEVGQEERRGRKEGRQKRRQSEEQSGRRETREGKGAGGGEGVKEAGGKKVEVLNEGDEEDVKEGEERRGSDLEGRERKERIVERKLLSVYTAVKVAGRVPAGLERIVQSVLKPQVDWRRVLREKMRAFFGSDYFPSWKKLNKKLPGIYPGKKYADQGEVIAIVDTSGSISERELQQFVSEVFAIARATRRKVIVIPFDATAYDPIEIRGSEDVRRVRVRGGGGTVIAPALKAAEKHMKPLTRIVVLSDWEISDLGTDFVQEWLRKHASQVLAVTTHVQPPSFLRSVKISF